MGPEGRPIEVIPAADKGAAHRELQSLLHRLVNEEGIASEDIIVLTPASEKRSGWKNAGQTVIRCAGFTILHNSNTHAPMEWPFMGNRICHRSR
jgi:hypothetical protein